MFLREAIVEQKSKEKVKAGILLTISRVFANIIVLALLAGAAYVIKLAGEYKLDVGLIISALTWLLPQLFEMVSFLERYPPPVFMKWQLVRVFVLYVANLASLQQKKMN